MSLTLPENRSQVVDGALADIQSELPDSTPTLPGFLRAIGTAEGFLGFDFYLQLQEVLRQSFPDTSDGEFLARWGSYRNAVQTQPTAASGPIVATGTLATTVLAGTTLVEPVSGNQYTVTVGGSVTDNGAVISSLTRVGSTVTAVTTSDHPYANEVSVTISGAVETDYNGSFSITATGARTFTYIIGATPSTPATGSIVASGVTVVLEVESNASGAEQNLANGAQLTFSPLIPSIDTTATVQPAAVAGGTNLEEEEAYRNRVLDAWRNPATPFNRAAIEQTAKSVAGVTRVFVEEATPAAGQVTVYFMRDNDESKIPDASEVATVEAAILAIKPANTADVDVIVSAPAEVVVPFTFTALSPDTSEMRSSVTANLGQFFEEEVDVAQNIAKNAYEAAIFRSYVISSDTRLVSFTLSTPTTDVTVGSGQIGVLGAINFNI